MTPRHTQMLIIGSGPAGHTAAIYGARAMLNPILVQGPQPGGQLTITDDVENWPGDTMVTGPGLMTRMDEHSRHLGVDIIEHQVTNLDLQQKPFLATLDNGETLRADTIVLATGAKARWLGLPKEDHFHGKGLSACATCDGFFFRNQVVAVVGGGNTAAEEALFLTRFATTVHLIHRRDSLRADKTLQERLKNNPKIQIHWNKKVTDLVGDTQGLTGIAWENTRTGETGNLACTGLFIAIGHDPATELVKGQLDLHESGHIKVKPHSTETSVPGVFAAGDVADAIYRQAITSAGHGCMAALDAERHLSHQEN